MDLIELTNSKSFLVSEVIQFTNQTYITMEPDFAYCPLLKWKTLPDQHYGPIPCCTCCYTQQQWQRQKWIWMAELIGYPYDLIQYFYWPDFRWSFQGKWPVAMVISSSISMCQQFLHNMYLHVNVFGHTDGVDVFLTHSRQEKGTYQLRTSWRMRVRRTVDPIGHHCPCTGTNLPLVSESHDLGRGTCDLV